jgi:hypothetical protein
MATDGVKIIDGDLAHDTYWGIMDLYDSGANLDTINKEFPLIKKEHTDEFDCEIYVTSCALALWEIGQMTNEKFKYVETIVNKGVSVEAWSIEDKNEGKARQKVLDKFLKKISETNNKIRPRKKYGKIRNLYFQPDDLLTFKLKDGNYRAVICALIDQYRGHCSYILVPTTYNSNKKPSVEDLKNKEILGRMMFSGLNRKATLEKQPGINRVWEFVGGNTTSQFGLVKFAVDHKDFMNFKDKFEKVGILKIMDGLKYTSSIGYEQNFERFEEIFNDLENEIRIFKYEKFPVTVLCEI